MCTIKNIYQYDINYNLIKIWESMKECENNNLYHTSLLKHIKNKTMYKNSYWSYEYITNKE